MPLRKTASANGGRLAILEMEYLWFGGQITILGNEWVKVFSLVVSSFHFQRKGMSWLGVAVAWCYFA